MSLHNLMVDLMNWAGIYDTIEGFLSGLGLSFIIPLTLYAIAALILFGFVAALVLVTTYLERKILSDIQVRLGPMETGGRRFHGILQPVADGIKLLQKEDIMPKNRDKLPYYLAPLVVFVPVFVIMGLIPLGFIPLDIASLNKNLLVAADLDIGILAILALAVIPTLGAVMAGWSSRNKFTTLAMLRSVAQGISYEIPFVLAALAVVLAAGSMNLSEIVKAQSGLWFIFLMPIGFIVFFMAALAEIHRIPFDVDEAENELVSGVIVEYSGMRFAFFYLAAYAELFIAAALITILFLGGWAGPVLPGVMWFFIKCFVIIYVIIWMRGTLPRVRIDQMLAVGWKVMLPLALLNLLITSSILML